MKGKERRRHKRYEVEGIGGLLTFFLEIKILNMSLEGLSIETTKMLTVNKGYSIKLYHRDKYLELRGRVVWSTLSRTEKLPDGDIVPVFMAGIHFHDVLDEKAISIIEFIQNNRILTLERRILGRFNIDSKNALIDYPQDFIVKKLSISGALIETEHPLEIESKVDLTIKIKENKKLSVTGRVVDVVGPKNQSRFYKAGIEFLVLNEKDRETIKDYLDSLNHI